MNLFFASTGHALLVEGVKELNWVTNPEQINILYPLTLLRIENLSPFGLWIFLFITPTFKILKMLECECSTLSYKLDFY